MQIAKVKSQKSKAKTIVKDLKTANVVIKTPRPYNARIKEVEIMIFLEA
jgi:hypothetical protein